MVTPIDGFNGNVSDLGSYSSASGLYNLKLDTASTSYWADQSADLYNRPFSTSPNVPDYGGDLLSSNPASGNSDAWTFITAPGTVSYSVSSEVERINIFGTNTPPVVASSRGMRDLTLSEALMEGFTLGKAVQKELDDLEKLMNVEVNSEDGFVSVPVYNVFAGGKPYGKYIIEQIEIDEQMRDLQGKATRAMVGVTLKQVPEYQVGTGIDQAGAATGGQSLDASKFTQADQQSANVAKNAKNTAAGSTGTGTGTGTGTTGAKPDDAANTNPAPVKAVDPSNVEAARRINK